MGYFASADEVYQFIGRIFEEALADPEVGPKMRESGVILQLHYTDPDSTITVDMPAGQVRYGPDDKVKPTIELSMKADVAHRFWLGKVNIPVALAKGEMRAKGPMPKLLALVPLAKGLFPRYEAMLKEAGRADLLSV